MSMALQLLLCIYFKRVAELEHVFDIVDLLLDFAQHVCLNVALFFVLLSLHSLCLNGNVWKLRIFQEVSVAILR